MNFENICPLNNNLQMGEILVYTNGGTMISNIVVVNLPFINGKINTTFINNNITINNLVTSFYPLTFTYYGKQYSNCNNTSSNELKILSNHTTTSNLTSLTLNNDKSLTLNIKTLGISSLGGNLSCKGKESLIAKISILYQVCPLTV